MQIVSRSLNSLIYIWQVVVVVWVYNWCSGLVATYIEWLPHTCYHTQLVVGYHSVPATFMVENPQEEKNNPITLILNTPFLWSQLCGHSLLNQGLVYHVSLLSPQIEVYQVFKTNPTGSVPVSKGVRQGCKAAPWLWNAVMTLLQDLSLEMLNGFFTTCKHLCRWLRWLPSGPHSTVRRKNYRNNEFFITSGWYTDITTYLGTITA